MLEYNRDRPRILVIHAYSAQNSGDRLLVEETLELLRSVWPDSVIDVIATDAESFRHHPMANQVKFHQWTSAWLPNPKKKASVRVSMLASSVTGGPGSIKILFKKADLVVAVGGGYLRGSSVSEALKTAGAHFGQLDLAARSRARKIYLPQSIGPFPNFLRRRIAGSLQAMDQVLVRDDRSRALFGDLGNVERISDLAVLKMAEVRTPRNLEITHGPVVVARQLSRPGSYENTLADLARSDHVVWAIQSTGGGNNDTPLTAKFSQETPKPLRHYLESPENRVVVSTRLHGSLSALLAGKPSVHLGYERKSWGAFHDLGLEQYVLDARRTSATRILDAVESIRDDPASYWNLIDSRIEAVASQRESLLASLAVPCHPPTGGMA
ncbi:polysaccharide pyruvyl transferase family protein [Rhodococcus erythropolis]|uniref:polysaccharide pyruvyl transferase family protein n=1 Tax=Rhodococcus erythropolis TaxID=1833 RepID=UPI00294951C8|nr:polysaccharide pyruvyl transferase family protein [Rhodococcus erythropolis]MDV6273485.1 polysaccharide pyruvyl transferase family protein [Rhodococcus erythropolis]